MVGSLGYNMVGSLGYNMVGSLGYNMVGSRGYNMVGSLGYNMVGSHGYNSYFACPHGCMTLLCVFSSSAKMQEMRLSQMKHSHFLLSQSYLRHV